MESWCKSINKYCTAVTRNSKNITKDVLEDITKGYKNKTEIEDCKKAIYKGIIGVDCSEKEFKNKLKSYYRSDKKQKINNFNFSDIDDALTNGKEAKKKFLH